MSAESDAVVAALKTAWPAGRVYKVGEVPLSPVTPYMDVAVGRGAPRNRRHASSGSSRFFRATVRIFGKNDAELDFIVRAETALLDKRVTPTATPCRQEITTQPMRDPDAGALLMILQTYTFTKPA